MTRCSDSTRLRMKAPRIVVSMELRFIADSSCSRGKLWQLPRPLPVRRSAPVWQLWSLRWALWQHCLLGGSFIFRTQRDMAGSEFIPHAVLAIQLPNVPHLRQIDNRPVAWVDDHLPGYGDNDEPMTD